MEPFLNMVNSFVFTGDFQDPFGEFFIDKLNYAKGSVFKFTDQPELKIPIFLSAENALLIYKTGSAVNLL